MDFLLYLYHDTGFKLIGGAGSAVKIHTVLYTVCLGCVCPCFYIASKLSWLHLTILQIHRHTIENTALTMLWYHKEFLKINSILL